MVQKTGAVGMARGGLAHSVGGHWLDKAKAAELHYGIVGVSMPGNAGFS